MKTTLFYGFIASLVLGLFLFSSCGDDDEVTPEPQANSNGQKQGNKVPIADEIKTPLTIETTADGIITFVNKASGGVIYRVDDGDPQVIASNNSGGIFVKAGQKVSFFGDNATYAASSLKEDRSNITCTVDFYVYGNIMSLINRNNYANITKLTAKNTFVGLFSNNEHLKNSPSRSLVLPATELAEVCYLSMFYGCTNLTEAPELPATTLKRSCYNSMFYGCKGLIETPNLPATTLAESCYSNMFYNCINLTKSTELPALKLERSCYFGMFQYCMKLVKAPDLPATTLAQNCYYDMFAACTRLTEAPDLLATILKDGCYHGMFTSCHNMTKEPIISATELAPGCCANMFDGCIRLKKAPELPAIELAEDCYSGMFRGCTSLTKAPDLPATNLKEGCYESMFLGCKNLIKIRCLATNDDTFGTEAWLYGVSPTGTFIKASGKTWQRGESGIPEGWQVISE